MTNLRGFNAYPIREGGFKSIDEVYQAVVLGEPIRTAAPTEQSFEKRFADDVVVPGLNTLVEHETSFFRSHFPKISSAFGRIFGAVDFITGAKDIYDGVQTDLANGRVGEETAVAVGRNVMKTLTASSIIGGGIALSSGVFPLLVPGILTVGLVGAGLYYLPGMVANGAERVIRGLGYVAGNSSEKGRESYEALAGTTQQVNRKFDQAEEAIDEFSDLLAKRKGF